MSKFINLLIVAFIGGSLILACAALTVVMYYYAVMTLWNFWEIGPNFGAFLIVGAALGGGGIMFWLTRYSAMETIGFWKQVKTYGHF